MNAFLTAPCAEKIRNTLGPEFGDDVGKKAIIVWALYGLKLAGYSFGNHISDCMRLFGYEPCREEPHLWFKVQVCPDDGFEYYEYVLLYVDDSLEISYDAMDALDRMDKFSMMKKGSIEDPDIYFEEKLRKVQLGHEPHKICTGGGEKCRITPHQGTWREEAPEESNCPVAIKVCIRNWHDTWVGT